MNFALPAPFHPHPAAPPAAHRPHAAPATRPRPGPVGPARQPRARPRYTPPKPSGRCAQSRPQGAKTAIWSPTKQARPPAPSAHPARSRGARHLLHGRRGRVSTGKAPIACNRRGQVTYPSPTPPGGPSGSQLGGPPPAICRLTIAPAARFRPHTAHGTPAPPTTTLHRHVAAGASMWRAPDFGDASSHVTLRQPTE